MGFNTLTLELTEQEKKIILTELTNVIYAGLGTIKPIEDIKGSELRDSKSYLDCYVTIAKQINKTYNQPTLSITTNIGTSSIVMFTLTNSKNPEVKQLGEKLNRAYKHACLCKENDHVHYHMDLNGKISSELINMYD
mgnify:CR=1 FL=1